MLIDTTWDGRPRQLLLHANRNGFFYVLDRTTGALLLAKPFVKKLTWPAASAPKAAAQPDQTPTADGRTVCPAVEGATNWFSTSFSPATSLYYVQALEKCTVYIATPETWRAGQSFYGGSTRQARRDRPEGAARHRRAHRRDCVGAAADRPGLVVGRHARHRRGLVFLGEDSGALMAVDAASGAPLWAFQTNAVEGVADDLRLRRPPARRRRGGPEHHRLHVGRLGSTRSRTT